MIDILERLKATTKVNGAYPKDIADAIAEIEHLRYKLNFYKKTLALYEDEDEL